MSDETTTGDSAVAGQKSPTTRRTRIDRARLEAVFGAVLPEQTSDERSPDGASSRGSGRDDQDEWLRRQVPPHHG
ncbi:hypothetical protein ERC79_17645 [Rhodococcus sp. ABRD24]|uniref:hypothetical protein n=1 Tax=Rhodococcus sp. ABRD24 TaxID=2507582 RepID=UPI00103C5588|nr:hypothetical protein [Rhodococcus sp. ABRD24]QBJ97559.1 hypothetical protein ERC79_17645 [Rhodococcus sp. ABRD24]